MIEQQYSHTVDFVAYFASSGDEEKTVLTYPATFVLDPPPHRPQLPNARKKMNVYRLGWVIFHSGTAWPCHYFIVCLFVCVCVCVWGVHFMYERSSLVRDSAENQFKGLQ